MEDFSDYDICESFDKYSIFKIIGYYQDKPIWNCIYTSKGTGEIGRIECEERLKEIAYDRRIKKNI